MDEHSVCIFFIEKKHCMYTSCDASCKHFITFILTLVQHFRNVIQMFCVCWDDYYRWSQFNMETCCGRVNLWMFSLNTSSFFPDFFFWFSQVKTDFYRVENALHYIKAWVYNYTVRRQDMYEEILYVTDTSVIYKDNVYVQKAYAKFILSSHFYLIWVWIYGNKSSLFISPDENEDKYLGLLYNLRYIVVFGLVEMGISTNPQPTIYRNLYENTGPG